MVTWPTRGFQNEWDQVHTGVPFKLFLFFSFGRVALVGAGRRNEPSIGRERRDNRRVNVKHAAAQSKHNVHACASGLCSRLGLWWEAWDGLLAVDLGARV